MSGSQTLDDLIREIENADRRTRARWAVRRAVGRIKRSPTTAHAASVYAWQRLTRGWDDRAAYNVCQSLPATLGAQLMRMAEVAHGWPGERYGTFENWVNDLRMHGSALVHYALAQDAASAEHVNLDNDRDAAQRAMHWVAVWLPALWD